MTQGPDIYITMLPDQRPDIYIAMLPDQGPDIYITMLPDRGASDSGVSADPIRAVSCGFCASRTDRLWRKTDPS
ncbi:hypothetical protein ACOMHN_019997 [Nucella lapillus]